VIEQVRGRDGGADGREVVHYFDTEDDARAMLRRMLETVPPELSDWAQMTAHKNRPALALGLEHVESAATAPARDDRTAREVRPTQMTV